MLQTLIDSLRAGASNDPAATTRRRHPRRHEDRCVVEIAGRTFPVENWSMGGLLLDGDDRVFNLGVDIDFTLKFRVRNAILNVHHRGRILRKGNGRIALRFEPLPTAVRHGFQRVVDDFVAREFVESQI